LTGLAHAQRLAKRGLGGEERGERVVGLACLVLGLVALVAAALQRPGFDVEHGVESALWTSFSLLGLGLFKIISVLAVGCGGSSFILAVMREAKRRAFIERVESCQEPGFRVEPTARGKVLLRIPAVDSYRVDSSGEEVFALNASDRAAR